MIVILPDEVIEGALTCKFVVADLAIENASIPHTLLVGACHGVEAFKVA